jgi:hypothetical protein
MQNHGKTEDLRQIRTCFLRLYAAADIRPPSKFYTICSNVQRISNCDLSLIKYMLYNIIISSQQTESSNAEQRTNSEEERWGWLAAWYSRFLLFVNTLVWYLRSEYNYIRKIKSVEAMHMGWSADMCMLWSDRKYHAFLSCISSYWASQITHKAANDLNSDELIASTSIVRYHYNWR